MKNLLNVTLISSIFLISACGGGGGGGSSSNSSGGGGNTGSTSNQVVINSFTADQTSVVAGCNSITLSWSSSYSTSCSASGSWDGSKATSGTEVLLMSDVGTFEYLLVCSNSSGSSPQKSVSIEVTENTSEVVTHMNRINHHIAEQRQIVGLIIG